MSPHKSSRRCAALLLAAGSLLVLAVCGEAEPELVTHGKLPLGQVWEGPEKKLYSQGNEELIIRDFFDDREGGVFLDVGSADPIRASTTYYLEKHLGWSGVAVDAQAQYAPAYRRDRPATRFVSFIVTDESGTKQKFYRIPAMPGLSSTEADREWAGERLGTDTIEMPTITLDSLLDAQGITRVDFLSMDIEEGEAKALSGFDIDRFRPQLVCIEISEKNEDFVAQYFAEHRYRRIEKYRKYDFVNDYYTPVEANYGGSGGA